MDDPTERFEQVCRRLERELAVIVVNVELSALRPSLGGWLTFIDRCGNAVLLQDPCE